MNATHAEPDKVLNDSFSPCDDDRSWRIVLVDDQSFDRAEAKEALLRGSTRRYTFVECETAAEALDVVAAAYPDGSAEECIDCVVLDYRLPDADAPELLDGLPRAEGFASIPAVPVVVITGADSGSSGSSLNREALRAGAQNFVGKDWLTPASLTRAVEGAAERHAMTLELAQRGRALKEGEERLRIALDAANLGAWSIDPEAERVTGDARTRSFFGLDDGNDALEAYLSRIQVPDLEQVQQALAKALQKEGVYDVEHRVSLPDGSTRWVHARGRAMRQPGGTTQLIGVTQDTTARREAAEALASLNNELEDRVAQRTAELERANEGLEERNLELQQFAYIASHDLQEPLRMVTSFLQLLQRRYEGELDETADEYIAYAVDGASRMKVLISDLLSFSRVGTRGQPLQRIDLNRVVETVLRDLGPKIEETGAEVEVGDLPKVDVDPSQIGQVFQNLISNAIKFRRPDVTSRVDVSAEQTDGLWTIRVHDNGIGLDPKYEDRVFQIFQRLHSREEYDGTGIGLAIVKRIVERHNGTVGYESTPEEGTTFLFTLPEHQPESARGASNENRPQDVRS